MRKKGTSSDGNNSFGGYKFLNVSLGVSDKERLSQATFGESYPIDGCTSLLLEGYKLSFSYDSKNHSFICSLTDNVQDSAFFKHILTGRGSSAVNAWLSVCYKHYVLAEQDWSAIAAPNMESYGDFG